MRDDRIYVAVVGSSVADEPTAASAYEVGAELARRGAYLVCGGLGGVMEAASKGARDGGGLTIGILPGIDRGDSNPYTDVTIPTGMGEMRNALVVRVAHVVIAVAGEFGTLSEISLALRVGTPVVGIDTWELSRRGRSVDAIVRAGSPKEAVELALDLADRAGNQG
jgi:uncharacterized protein (TIGR00725 family)